MGCDVRIGRARPFPSVPRIDFPCEGPVDTFDAAPPLRGGPVCAARELRANTFRCRRICTPATPGAPVPTLSPAQKQYALVLKSRDVERNRFGMPVLQDLLAAGFVGVVLHALEWWTERIIPPESLSASLLSLPASSPVISQVQARALLSDVRGVCSIGTASGLGRPAWYRCQTGAGAASLRRRGTDAQGARRATAAQPAQHGRPPG